MIISDNSDLIEAQSRSELFKTTELNNVSESSENQNLREQILEKAKLQIQTVLATEFSSYAINLALTNILQKSWEEISSSSGLRARAIGELKSNQIFDPSQEEIEAMAQALPELNEAEFKSKVERVQRANIESKKAKLISILENLRNVQLSIQGNLGNTIRIFEERILISNLDFGGLQFDLNKIEDLAKPNKSSNAYLGILKSICNENDLDVALSGKRIVLSSELSAEEVKALNPLLNLTSDVETLNLVGEITLEILELSRQGKIVTPTASELSSIQKHLVKAKDKGLKIISTACPPYKFNRVTSQFTGEPGFDDDIGIVTETIIDGAPNVLQILSKLGIEYAVGYADFEGSNQNAINNGFNNSSEFVDELVLRANSISEELDLNIGLITEITGVTREEFWAIRNMLNLSGNFVVMRKIDERLGVATNAADWAVMAMIAASQNLFILDAASTEVARKFYARGQRIMHAINQLQRADLSEKTLQRVQQQLLNALKGDNEELQDISQKMNEKGLVFEPKEPDWEVIENLIHIITTVLGTGYNQVGVVYLPQRYSEE